MAVAIWVMDNPHNIYFLAETGLVGTLVVLGPLLFFVSLFRRASNRWLFLVCADIDPLPDRISHTASGTHYWLLPLVVAALAPSDLPSGGGRNTAPRDTGLSRLYAAHQCQSRRLFDGDLFHLDAVAKHFGLLAQCP